MFTEVFCLVAKKLKTIPIPIKREEYIQMEGGVNETMSKVNLLF